MKSVGIDLAGKDENPTGAATLEDQKIRTHILHSNEEIVESCQVMNPDVVAIDAPLSFPAEGNLREADSELVKRGYQVLPPNLGGMKFLTERGIELAGELRELGFKVIEVHPRTSALIIYESDLREDWISNLLEDWGMDSGFSEHEVDSALAAITGILYLMGKVEGVGAESEEIIIPQEGVTVP